MRLGLGLGLGIGRRRAAADPTAALVALLGADAAQFLTPTLAHLYQTDDASTPVTTAAQAVGRRHDRAGGLHRTQSTAGSRPTWQAGPAVRYDGGDYLSGTAVTLPAGAVTIYAVGTRAGATEWLPLGSGDSAQVRMASDDSVYVVRAVAAGGGSVSAAYTGSTGVWHFAATGMAEASLGSLTGTWGLEWEGASGAGGTPSQFTGANNDHRATLVAAADLVADGRDQRVRDYVWQAYGVWL